LASSLAACGGKAVGAIDPDAGGSSQGGSGNGSAAASASGGGAVCASYEDDVATSVNIDIVNATSAPLFLGQKRIDCSPWAPYTVKDENGVELAPVNDFCRSPCDVVAESGPLGCPLICVVPPAVALNPGATFHTGWGGRYADALVLPKECVSPGGSSECERASIIQPGRFTFAVRAATGLDCTQAGPEPCGPCSDGADVCLIDGALIAGDLRNASASVLLDSEYGVFPSSRPRRPPPDSSPERAPPARTVQLVFRD